MVTPRPTQSASCERWNFGEHHFERGAEGKWPPSERGRDLVSRPQTEEGVAEEEVLGEEWFPDYLAWNGKIPDALLPLVHLHEKLHPPVCMPIIQ